MQYRPASPADGLVLAQMNLRLIRDEGHRNRMSLAELKQRMLGWLQGEYRAVLFENEQGTAGYALYRHEPEWVYLRQFFVESDWRRKGIGRAAIGWLLANVWKDSPRIRIDVLSGNLGGIEFWRSLGFNDYCVTMEHERRLHDRPERVASSP